jgi:hypothetical protein
MPETLTWRKRQRKRKRKRKKEGEEPGAKLDMKPCRKTVSEAGDRGSLRGEGRRETLISGSRTRRARAGMGEEENLGAALGHENPNRVQAKQSEEQALELLCAEKAD